MALLKRLFQDVRSHVVYGYYVSRKPSEFLLDGIRIPLSATPQLSTVRRRIYQGRYESPERDAIRHLIRPDDVVLELGSGVGIVSAFIASLLKDSRHLTTVEANPDLLPSIQAVATANGFQYTPLLGAVGENEGEVSFFVDDVFESSSSFDRSRSARKITVPQFAFARLLEEVAPTALVIDVEGAEQSVLKHKLPSRVRAVCAEFHPHITGDKVVSTLISELIAQGFALQLDHSSERVLAFAR